MSARERKLVLVALLISAGGGSVYWNFFSAPATVANGGAAATAPAVPAASRIQTDLMMASEARASAGRNPFSFDRAVINVPPPPPTVLPPPPPPPPIAVTPQPVRPAAPTATAVATAPAVPLQYTGYARDGANRMVAFLETNGTGAPVGHYNLREDDFLLGRFRVSKITADSVEVEDMERPENNRKQTIAISPTIAVRR